MNNHNCLSVLLTFLALLVGCTNSNKNQMPVKKADTVKESQAKLPVAQPKKEITDFIPEGYKIFKKIYGDLNKDGVDDCVIIIKGTAKENIIVDENRGKLDRNRRGIIVLFKEKDNYVLATKNYDCFSSENEDGGVYFPPELDVSVEKGKLYVHYGHGKYGYWTYTFKLKNTDFELIGYDASESNGPVVSSETSINFLTKKELIKTNTNKNAESGDEVFEETRKDIKIEELIKLSEIKDFDELEIN